MLRFVSCSPIDNSHIYEDQKNACCDKYSSAYTYGNFQWPDIFAKSFVIFTPGIFLFVLPTLTSFQSWCEILLSRIKSNSFVQVGRCTNYLQKVTPARISNVRLVFFVIRNNPGVQIFRNDEKARQRHLPKMYTLVVTMNWNRFRKIFRIRFCIFYNRSELSQCVENRFLALLFTSNQFWTDSRFRPGSATPYKENTFQRFSRAGPRGRGREWATLGVHPLSWLLSNNRLEEVCSTLTKGTFSSRLLLSNQDKGCIRGCIPSVAHSLPLPLGPALLNLSTNAESMIHYHVNVLGHFKSTLS